MRPARLSKILPVAAIALLAACASAPPPTTKAPATPYPPEACKQAIKNVEHLKLSRTKEGDGDQLSKVIRIGRSLSKLSDWTDRADGWSVSTLMMTSSGAQSLSAQLSELELPRGVQVWLCSTDGRVRHGPYRADDGASVWTPVVPGDTAMLQLWSPSNARLTIKGELESVQGGYR